MQIIKNISSIVAQCFNIPRKTALFLLLDLFNNVSIIWNNMLFAISLDRT